VAGRARGPRHRAVIHQRLGVTREARERARRVAALARRRPNRYVIGRRGHHRRGAHETLARPVAGRAPAGDASMVHRRVRTERREVRRRVAALTRRGRRHVVTWLRLDRRGPAVGLARVVTGRATRGDPGVVHRRVRTKRRGRLVAGLAGRRHRDVPRALRLRRHARERRPGRARRVTARAPRRDPGVIHHPRARPHVAAGMTQRARLGGRDVIGRHPTGDTGAERGGRAVAGPALASGRVRRRRRPRHHRRGTHEALALLVAGRARGPRHRAVIHQRLGVTREARERARRVAALACRRTNRYVIGRRGHHRRGAHETLARPVTGRARRSRHRAVIHQRLGVAREAGEVARPVAALAPRRRRDVVGPLRHRRHPEERLAGRARHVAARAPRGDPGVVHLPGVRPHPARVTARARRGSRDVIRR